MTHDVSRARTPSTSAVAGRLDAIIVPVCPWRGRPRRRRASVGSAQRAARRPVQQGHLRARGGGSTRPYPPMPCPGRRRPTRLPARPAADPDGRPAVPGRQRQPAVRPQPQAQPRAADRPAPRLGQDPLPGRRHRRHHLRNPGRSTCRSRPSAGRGAGRPPDRRPHLSRVPGQLRGVPRPTPGRVPAGHLRLRVRPWR